ncbi:MAG: hypothetical protein WA797_08320 [Acidimicrobiales bacterium]
MAPATIIDDIRHALPEGRLGHLTTVNADGRHIGGVGPWAT